MSAPRKMAPVRAPLHEVRGCQIILDHDLAPLFGVSTKRLNEQVRRNRERFPDAFAFRLSQTETAALRSQFATSNQRGGRRYAPMAFTEHGVVMAATILRSASAVAMSLRNVEEFIRLRKALQLHEELRRRLSELSTEVSARLDGHDAEIARIFELIEDLLDHPGKTGRRIGFIR